MAGVLCSGCGTVNGAATKFCIECGMATSGRVASPVKEARSSTSLRTSPREDTSPPASDRREALPAREWASQSPLRTAAIGTLIFVFAFTGYFLSTRVQVEAGASLGWLDPPPRCCMFYADLADAFNHGTFDLTEIGVPPSHPDLLAKDGKLFLPYQPVPAVLLMPIVAIWGTGLTQLTFSIALGAVNVVLFWYILRLLNISRETKLLLIPFFAFGTAHFYSATTGSLWFYNHVAAVFFLLLAMIFLLRRDSPILPALCIGAAALSRQPIVLAAPAFMYFMIEQRNPGVWARVNIFGAVRDLPGQLREALRRLLEDRRTLVSLAVFVAVLVPFGLITLWYNEARFGNVFETGLDELYAKYEGVPYTQYLAAGGERFAQFDVRNIPVHLYTMFLQPPDFSTDGSLLQPSRFGMSVLLTSSPLVFGALVRRRDALKRACWIALAMVPIPTLLYYSAGWVQFGYRYMLDYLPFLMILTAFGFDDHRSPTAFRIKVVLVVLSLAIGFWGRYWGTRLGW